MPRRGGTPENLIKGGFPTGAQSLGGKRAQETIRRKKKLQETAKAVLDLIPNKSPDMLAIFRKLGVDEDGAAKMTIEQIAIVAIAKKAINGDSEALKQLLELSGYEDSKIEIERLKLELEWYKASMEEKSDDGIGKLGQLLQGIDDAAKRETT